MDINKKNKKIVLKSLSTSSFWIEYITLYFSILIVTLSVQVIIFRIDLIVVFLCLSKSLFTTIPNILIIMYGRRINMVRKNKILQSLIYAFSSLPYLDITILLLYKKEFYFFFEILFSYILVYFFVGFFVDKYILFSKKILYKIFYGDTWSPFFLIKKIHNIIMDCLVMVCFLMFLRLYKILSQELIPRLELFLFLTLSLL